MNKQSGMTLLEVLLAMSIFTAVALTLMSSMQGQRNAIERMRNETLALWIADNQLQSQDSFGEENTSSSGKELINGEEWNWRSDIHSSKDGTLLERTITVTLPSGQTADMTLSFHSQLQRTRQVNHHLQRQYDIELAEKLALASLTQDVKDNDRQTTLQQYWAQPQQLQLEDGNTVKWQLRDAQHCFNLNALAKISDDPLASPDFPAQVFSALLINAGIDRGNTDEIVQSIADYIDVDDSPRFHGAEDSFYQSQTPPRHSANQMLFLTGELRQIKGITENIYQRLIPYVCVLPTTELSINLNMLTENDIPLFRALFLNNITDADARVLLQKRPREGWLTTDAFLYWAQQDFSGVKPLVAQVKRHLFPYSRYFTLSTESISDEQSQGWQSHIFFNRKQQSAQIYRRTLQLY
ncbi:type II secretion system minor pseudopilin GspK [Escherichia coli]|nr:type II secretion system minor pseudopilin GspK [Escherichia coli]